MFGNEKKTVATVRKETTFAKQLLPSICKMRKSNDGDVLRLLVESYPNRPREGIEVHFKKVEKVEIA